MKSTYTRLLARKMLLAFLAIIIPLAIAAIFVRDTITNKLADITRLASGVESRLKPEQALLLLHQAEDDFQASLLDINSPKSLEYKANLTLAFNKIDTLLKIHADTTQLTAAQSKQVKVWYQKKLKLSARLFALKHNFDSLLTVYSEFNNQDAQNNKPVVSVDVSNSKKIIKATPDTIIKAIRVNKKGLFARLKDAISNKPATASSVIEINHNTALANQTTETILSRDKVNVSKKLQQLQQQNVKLLNMQRELITLNAHISSELERILRDLKELNYDMSSQLKGMALKNYQETTSLLNKFYLAALFLVLIFAALLILFITKLNKAELRLLNENHRAIKVSRQKMDLLLNMSHEIRNPLTAIRGFLSIFGRTTLSERQTEMLESIKSSSDMLLRTLNDTLDAGKMENSELKIESEPFNPDHTLNQVMESMSYSAIKKQLDFQYNFKGNKQALVLGDSFRLQQILVNLLSNAIKYTNKGSITLNAELLEGETTQLQVDVTDTGEGIPTEQQTNLFSKYYQTSSAKGKVGTGLGLFICKQLVKMQNGKISVKSSPGKGSTFSFFIPYKKHVAVADQQSQDPISLLNGLDVLAVEDNELNLMFLKLIMSKWNVTFHQAVNGKEALDILHTTKISLVLTDLQMPEMDGYELLNAIRNSKEAFSQLPVIAISGISPDTDEKSFVKQGFSGLISKPFVENELIARIVNVMGKKPDLIK